MLIRIGKHLINSAAIAYVTIDEKWRNTSGDERPALTIVFTAVHDTIYLYGDEATATYRFLDAEAVPVRTGSPD